ncbi:hypothetical protein ES708_06133 [subsurface metagenome]
MERKGDRVGALAILVLLTGVVLCMTNTAWFPWANFAGLLIALGAVVFIRKRPAQAAPGFKRPSREGVGK